MLMYYFYLEIHKIRIKKKDFKLNIQGTDERDLD